MFGSVCCKQIALKLAHGKIKIYSMMPSIFENVRCNPFCECGHSGDVQVDLVDSSQLLGFTRTSLEIA